MIILFLSRKTLFSDPGGDTVQILKSAEAIRQFGVSVNISTELNPKLSGYDLVHIFNMTRPQEAYIQMLYAKKAGVPLALSTIYVDYSESNKIFPFGLLGYLAKWINESKIETLKIIGRALLGNEFHYGILPVIRKGYRNCLKDICSMADILFPNSFSELRRIENRLNIKLKNPFRVIPNAVDIDFFSRNKAIIPFNLKHYEGCILCVARIDRRKNQLNLIRASSNLKVPLILAGSPSKNQRGYYKQILKESGDNVILLGHRSTDEVRILYKLCKVHALVSWMETTGLSSLEAGAMGANLVITDKGDTKEYFREDAFYCHPDDIDSITTALKDALTATPSSLLQSRIQHDFTWNKAALKTIEGYKMVLNKIN